MSPTVMATRSQSRRLLSMAEFEEHQEIPVGAGHLKSCPYTPDLMRLQRRLLANDTGPCSSWRKPQRPDAGRRRVTTSREPTPRFHPKQLPDRQPNRQVDSLISWQFAPIAEIHTIKRCSVTGCCHLSSYNAGSAPSVHVVEPVGEGEESVGRGELRVKFDGTLQKVPGLRWFVSFVSRCHSSRPRRKQSYASVLPVCSGASRCRSPPSG